MFVAILLIGCPSIGFALQGEVISVSGPFADRDEAEKYVLARTIANDLWYDIREVTTPDPLDADTGTVAPKIDGPMWKDIRKKI